MATGLEIEPQNKPHFMKVVMRVVLLVVFVAGAWFGYRYYTTGEQPPIPFQLPAANSTVDETEVSVVQKNDHIVDAAAPRYITVRSLGIEKARVLGMGLTANGEFDTPNNIHDAGWYQESATPGSRGGAVLLDGHNGGPRKDGIFKQLPTVRIGDEIMIERGDGQKFTYVVRENETVSVEQLNDGGMKRMSTSADETKEGLSIISCTGNGVPALNTYDQRVAVRAVAVE